MLSDHIFPIIRGDLVKSSVYHERIVKEVDSALW